MIKRGIEIRTGNRGHSLYGGDSYFQSLYATGLYSSKLSGKTNEHIMYGKG